MADLQDTLRSHTCFHASYQTGADADVSRGDGSASLQSEAAHWDPSAGRAGGALVFTGADWGWAEDECTYPAAGNFPWEADGFGGTVSMWLSCDPDADLNPEVPSIPSTSVAGQPTGPSTWT